MVIYSILINTRCVKSLKEFCDTNYICLVLKINDILNSTNNLIFFSRRQTYYQTFCFKFEKILYYNEFTFWHYFSQYKICFKYFFFLVQLIPFEKINLFILPLKLNAFILIRK